MLADILIMYGDIIPDNIRRKGTAIHNDIFQFT